MQQPCCSMGGILPPPQHATQHDFYVAALRAAPEKGNLGAGNKGLYPRLSWQQLATAGKQGLKAILGCLGRRRREPRLSTRATLDVRDQRSRRRRRRI
jgi:hypothetical protein